MRARELRETDVLELGSRAALSIHLENLGVYRRRFDLFSLYLLGTGAEGRRRLMPMYKGAA